MTQYKKRLPAIPKKDLILKQGPTTAKIKVRLDDRTTVTIRHISALKLWQVKYPNAYVIDPKAA